MTRETGVFGGAAFRYDPAGRTLSIDQGDGLAVYYSYDHAGRMRDVVEGGSGVVLAEYSYDEMGRRTAIGRGNGAHTYYCSTATSAAA